MLVKQVKTRNIMVKEEKMDIRKATEKWVEGFNAIPKSLIEKAYCNESWELNEITPIKYICNECNEEFTEDEGQNCPLCDSDNYSEQEYYSYLPMWGTMWTFGTRLDEYWAYEHLQDIADCGFRIYESDELGLFFGIDGAGYDFYESHWIPLYRARGLKWHKNIA